jgi:beta-lactamase class D
MKHFIKYLIVIFLISTLGYAEELRSLIIKKMNSQKILWQEGNISLRKSPCCSFNIALSLMGFDAGILENDTSPTWLYEEKYQASLAIHKEAHCPKTWIQHSCVWYSQVLTQKLGFEKFQNYVKLFEYGNEDVSGDADKNNGLFQSWLCSSLQISPIEQISFLEKLVQKKLPVSSHAFEMTQKILFVANFSSGWKLYGKTGTGFQTKELQFGWFVGWATKEEKTLLIALLLQDTTKESEPAGPRAKEQIKSMITSWKD